ncbi:MAG: AI-2E family transporter, partial [Actinomycetota bacterium]|nr:AI-2E family transporter [Actinomycetota bacterium]
DVEKPTKLGRQKREPEGSKGEPDVTAHPTPIRISRRTRTALLLAVLVALAYVVYRVPDVLTMTGGGIALALILSFPVGFLSRFMRRGLAILLSFLLVVGLIVLAAIYLVPLVVEQLASLVSAVPEIANTVGQYLQNALDFLQNRGLLPSDPQQIISRIRDDAANAAQTVAGSVLSGAFGFVYSTFGFVVTLFGIIFIGAYLLVDVRLVEATFLRAVPHDYRHDAKTLWEAFGYSLSKYLGGLALVLAIQGAISAVGLFLLGVPYALVLGAVVSVMAVIPYLGAWISGTLAVIVALTVSPTTTLLTAFLFLGIQQLEGNFLTPKIQGDTLHVHPILIFLAVIIGGGLGGIPGVVVAVPTSAVLRVLFDFFRVRLKTDG